MKIMKKMITMLLLTGCLGESSTNTSSSDTSDDNLKPIANDDFYKIIVEDEFDIGIIDAPGVLENDFDANDDKLISYLSSNPDDEINETQSENGLSVILNEDGSFNYFANDMNGFDVNCDSFVYYVFDELDLNDSAVVNISVCRVIEDCMDCGKKYE